MDSGTLGDVAALRAENARLRAENRRLAEQHRRDVGDLREALAETRHAREQIDGILQSVADPLIVTDPYSRIVLRNRAAEDLLGLVPAEALGRRLVEAVADPVLGRQIEAAPHRGHFCLGTDGRLPPPRSQRAGGFQGRTPPFRDSNGRQAGGAGRDHRFYVHTPRSLTSDQLKKKKTKLPSLGFLP